MRDRGVRKKFRFKNGYSETNVILEFIGIEDVNFCFWIRAVKKFCNQSGECVGLFKLTPGKICELCCLSIE